MCGCRHPGAAADRPPRAPPSKHPGAANGASLPQRQEALPKPQNDLMNEKKENFSEKKADAEMTKTADQDQGGEGRLVNAVAASKR